MFFLVMTWDSVVPVHSRGSELVSTLFSEAGDSHHAFLSVQKKGIIILARDVTTSLPLESVPKYSLCPQLTWQRKPSQGEYVLPNYWLKKGHMWHNINGDSKAQTSDHSEVPPRNGKLRVSHWLMAWGSCHLAGVHLLPAVRRCLQLSTCGWHRLPKPPAFLSLHSHALPQKEKSCNRSFMDLFTQASNCEREKLGDIIMPQSICFLMVMFF